MRISFHFIDQIVSFRKVIQSNMESGQFHQQLALLLRRTYGLD